MLQHCCFTLLSASNLFTLSFLTCPWVTTCLKQHKIIIIMFVLRPQTWWRGSQVCSRFTSWARLVCPPSLPMWLAGRRSWSAQPCLQTGPWTLVDRPDITCWTISLLELSQLLSPSCQRASWLNWYTKTARDQMVSHWFHLKAAGPWRGMWQLSAPRLTLTLILPCRVLAVWRRWQPLTRG